MDTVDIRDASVLVLGGTGELGRRIASRLSAQGALVTVAGRNRSTGAAVANEVGGVFESFDFRDDASLSRPAAKAVETFGRLDGIVNAAGVVAFGPLSDTPKAVLDEIITVNLTAPLTLYSNAIGIMTGGFIVNITGAVASLPTAGMVAYSASKAGLSAATMALARETRRDGFLIIDAQPAHTETGLTSRALIGEAPRLPSGLDPNFVAERIVEGIALGKRSLPIEWFSDADASTPQRSGVAQ